jgi:hypothetical protein
MKKIMLIVGLVVIVGGIAGYVVWSGAQKDTENITTLQVEKMSKEEVGLLKEKAAEGIGAANQAAKAAKELGLEEQLKVWETQLGATDAAVRMTALRELARLHAKSPEKVVALVGKVAAEDADEDVQMMAGMLIEEWAGDGEDDGEDEFEEEEGEEASEGEEEGE